MLEFANREGFASYDTVIAQSDPFRSPVVFVHGLVGSLDYFDPADRLANLDVHTIDLQGYGGHANVAASDLSLANQVTHVQAFIQALGAAPLWLVGHSMGGAIAMLLADRTPDLVRGIINVEGNFTRKDAFWSSRIMGMSETRCGDEFRRMKADITAWLATCDIEATPQRVAWATGILNHQTTETVRAMSRALVQETCAPEYMNAVRRVVNRRIEIHLVAGGKSAVRWDVPALVRRAAASDSTIENTGHMMMLEAPAAFCETISRIVHGAG